MIFFHNILSIYSSNNVNLKHACLVAQSYLTDPSHVCNPMDCIVCQTSLSIGFSRQEYWRGLPFPTPGDLPPKIKPVSLVSPALAGGFFTTAPPGSPLILRQSVKEISNSWILSQILLASHSPCFTTLTETMHFRIMQREATAPICTSLN